MSDQIDDIDRKIIDSLVADGRRSNIAIADKLGVSEGTVRRRLKLMRNSGALIIRAIPDPSALGFEVSAVLGLDVDPGQTAAIVDRLKDFEEVGLVGLVAGPFDLVTWVLARDLKDLRRFLIDVLGQVPGIKNIETLVMLEVIKRDYGRVAWVGDS